MWFSKRNKHKEQAKKEFSNILSLICSHISEKDLAWIIDKYSTQVFRITDKNKIELHECNYELHPQIAVELLFDRLFE